jgi:hypothetical protein
MRHQTPEGYNIMKSYYKHIRGFRQRLIQKFGQHLKFFLYLAVLVLIMIGNNFASFRNEDQPNPGKSIGENHSPDPEDSKSIGDVQNGMTPIHLHTPLNSKFGIGKEQQIELVPAYSGSNIGQWDKYYIQSHMKPNHDGLWDWENYWVEDLVSYAIDYQEGSEYHDSAERLESFLNPPNQDVNERNPQEQMFISSIEYPKSNLGGGGYQAGFSGGSGGSMSSGGSYSKASGISQNNNGSPIETPEPSTLILFAIGILLVMRRVNPRTSNP